MVRRGSLLLGLGGEFSGPGRAPSGFPGGNRSSGGPGSCLIFPGRAPHLPGFQGGRHPNGPPGIGPQGPDQHRYRQGGLRGGDHPSGECHLGTGPGHHRQDPQLRLREKRQRDLCGGIRRASAPARGPEAAHRDRAGDHQGDSTEVSGCRGCEEVSGTSAFSPGEDLRLGDHRAEGLGLWDRRGRRGLRRSGSSQGRPGEGPFQGDCDHRYPHHHRTPGEDLGADRYASQADLDRDPGHGGQPGSPAGSGAGVWNRNQLHQLGQFLGFCLLDQFPVLYLPDPGREGASQPFHLGGIFAQSGGLPFDLCP